MQCSSKPPVLFAPSCWSLCTYQMVTYLDLPVFATFQLLRFPTDLFPRCPLASQLVAIIKSLGQTLDCIRSYNLYCFKVFIDEIAARARLTGRYSSELARCSLDSHPFWSIYIGDFPYLPNFYNIIFVILPSSDFFSWKVFAFFFFSPLFLILL